MHTVCTDGLKIKNICICMYRLYLEGYKKAGKIAFRKVRPRAGLAFHCGTFCIFFFLTYRLCIRTTYHRQSNSFIPINEKNNYLLSPLSPLCSLLEPIFPKENKTYQPNLQKQVFLPQPLSIPLAGQPTESPNTVICNKEVKSFNPSPLRPFILPVMPHTEN